MKSTCSFNFVFPNLSFFFFFFTTYTLKFCFVFYKPKKAKSSLLGTKYTNLSLFLGSALNTSDMLL